MKREQRGVRKARGQKSKGKVWLGAATAGVIAAAAGAQALGGAPNGLQKDSSNRMSPTDNVVPQTVPPGGITPVNPTPADLAHIQTLSSMGPMRTALMQTFPSSFGGLYDSNGQGSFVVLFVGGAAEQTAIANYVNNYLKQASPTDTIATPISYHPTVHTLSSLFALRDKIASAAGSGTSNATGGVRVLSVGVNDKTNTVQVMVPKTDSADSDTSALQSKFQSSALEALPSAIPTLTDRTSDTPPWNGGDQIVLGNGPLQGAACTTAFGAHDGNGNQYQLTAGHCTDGNTGTAYKWYNTSQSAPDFSNSRFMGVPDVSLVNPATFTGWDAERIPTPASNLFWKETSTREYVANDAAPVTGNEVCAEGSFGFENCGVVGLTDQLEPFFPQGTFGGEFEVLGAPTISGDSGGPIIWPTGYGYIAQGIITGSDGVNTWGCGINYAEFLMGITVNSLVKGS